MTLPTCPYKGLVPYTEEDEPFFFGRDAEREIIAANLMASRLTLVYGPSGVGKSSILQAGVMHDMRRRSNDSVRLSGNGNPDFIVLIMNSWSGDPAIDLADHINTSVKDFVGDRLELDQPESRSLVEILGFWTDRLHCDLYIILDQFEEYFTYHGQAGNGDTFAVEFARILRRRDLRVNFVVSIREDALAKLDYFKGKIPGLFDNYLRIDHLDLESGRAAVEKPIGVYNAMQDDGGLPVEIETALVEAVLDQTRTGRDLFDVTGRGGIRNGGEKTAHIEAPYLQLVMTRLWNEEMTAGKRILKHGTLGKLGGAEQIVSSHLDEAMEKLTVEQQWIAARAFHFLVTPSGMKIAHTIEDLADSEYVNAPQSELKQVLDKLSAPHIRIMRTVAPSPGKPGVKRYEIFHDVLGQAVRSWRARYVKEREQREAEKKAAEDAAAKERETAARERETARSRYLKRLKYLVITLSVAFTIAIITSLIALNRNDYAEDQKEISLARGLAAQSELTFRSRGDLLPRSVLLAVESMRRYHTLEGDIALRQGISRLVPETARLTHEGEVYAVAFSPNGELVATGSYRKARIFLVHPKDLMREACTRLTRNLTREEWRQYLRDEPYRPTCPNLPAPDSDK